MGKTLVSILEVAAVVAVQAIPGVGQAVAGFAASIGIGISAAAGTAIASAALIGAEAFANSILFQVRPSATDSAVKSATPERIRGYGINGIYGAYIFYQTDSRYGVGGDVYAFHDNPWAPIGGVMGFYLGDDRVANDRGVIAGLPDGTYTEGSVEIDYRLGARTETPFYQIVNLFPSWSADHRGDGVTTGMVTWQPIKTKDYQKVYPKGQPALRMIAKLSTVYDWRDGAQVLTDPLTWKFSENPVLHRAHYELITDGKQPVLPISDPGYAAELASILSVKWAKLFAPSLAYWTAAANDADSTMPIDTYTVLLSANDSSDGNHTILLPNALGLQVGMSITITSIDDITHTEIVTATSIFDTGNGVQVGINPEVQYYHGQNSAVSWHADASHSLTEPRYRGCVVHKLTDAHKDSKAAIAACFDGWIAPREDGALVCYSGRFYAPTVTIGPDKIISHSIDDGIDDEDAINTLVVTYISANHNYSVVECTAWTDDDDITMRGAIRSQSLQNQVPSYTQARRLAKRQLARVMARYRGTVTTNAAGRIAIGERFVHLTIIEGGASWYDGPAEITALTHNLTTGGVTFSWVSADANIDDWTPATDEGEGAPIGNRVAGAALDAPVITASEVDFGAQAADGASGAYLNLTVSGPNRSDITWFARTREVGASVWGERTYTDIPAGASVMIETEFVPTDTTVEAEIAYQTGDGSVSPWSVHVVADTHTDQAVPDPAAVATLVRWGATLDLQTALIPRARSYRWRFYKADGTTFIVSYDTTDRSISYTAKQAAMDGVQRGYVVKVAGVNGAGEGTAALTGVLTNPAPAAVASPAIDGGATAATATCTGSSDDDLSGYIVFYSASSGFDPTTTGGVVTSGTPSVSIFGLAAGSYYGRVAAFDDWTSNPALLNLSTEIPFAITTGGGSTPSGGGADGGGYAGACPEISEPILMANEALDGAGREKAASDVEEGDWVWTQHERTGLWGAYRVTHAITVASELMCAVDFPRTSPSHRFALCGEWTRMDQFGLPDGQGFVRVLTVEHAGTYVCRGRLSHNKTVSQN